MIKNKKTILLWNPISNHGHLNMYLEIYSSVLLDLGYEVFYFANLDERFEKILKNKFPNLKSVDDLNGQPFLKRWSSKWFIHIVKNLISNGKNRLFDRRHLIAKLFRVRSNSVEFEVLTRKLESLIASGFSVDLIICMYLDMTHLDRRSKKFFKKFSLSWTGLLFHPSPILGETKFARDSWFIDDANVGGIFFTNKEFQSYQKIAKPHQIFAVFPDVSVKTSNSKQNSNFNIRQLANGRKILSLVGALDGNKKLIKEFLNLTYDDRMKDFFFLIAGEVYESTLDSDTLFKIRRLSGSVQENLFIYDQYIESEKDFEQLIEQSDFLFACYKDFDSSANILAKSALFQKPVMVSDGTWLGNLVREYQLGLTVKSLRHDEFVETALQLAKIPHEKFRFDDYEFYVSIANLRIYMEKYLDDLWESVS